MDVLAFAVVHALLFALAFPPFDLWFLAFAIPLPLAWLALRARRTWHALAAVIAAQFFVWLWLNRWIVPVTEIGYPFLGLYMAMFPAMLAWIVRRTARQRALRIVPMTVILPMTWTGIEFLRGHIAFDGYPWYLLAHPLVEWPMFAQSADVFGSYFISMLATLPAGVALDLWIRPLRSGRALIVASACIVLAANVVYGAWRMSEQSPRSPGPSIVAIQTNLPQDNKIGWTREEQVRDFRAFCEQTIQACEQLVREGHPIDLIVWPETMLPGFGLDPETLKYLAAGEYVPGDFFAREIRAIQQRLGVPMLVGSATFLGLRAVDRRWQWDVQYNSAYLVTADQPHQRYDKYFLTPFGETMPYISKWPWLQQKMLDFGARGMKFDLHSNPDVQLLKLPRARAASPDSASPRFDETSLKSQGFSAPDMAAGEDAAARQTAGEDAAARASYTLATPICFEDTVPWLCRQMVYERGRKRADVLVNLSNDGWFTTSQADRKMHAQIARYRCIENRVPMVRCVNTGLSVSIDSTGRVMGAVGPGRYGASQAAGALLAHTTLDSRRTLYGRIGETFAWICLAGTILGLILSYLSRTNAESSRGLSS